MTPFLVCQFGKSTLSNLVKECFGSDFPDILRKPQINYAFHYLQALNAQSVLLESEYIDKDFLEDCERYYLRRFGANGHKCARLHFFSEQVTHQRIEELLNNGDETKLAELQACYLGFMVVKPLPRTFIGKSCFKQYKGFNVDDTKRLLARRYEVNLFGISLSVDSIAFQEQDKVVSACATTAIWSALNALSWIPVRAIPSCSEITSNAINFIHGSSNSFPSRELSNKQILRALDVAGLRYHAEQLNRVSQSELIDTVKCHVDSSLPLILGVKVFGLKNGAWLEKAGHAVTILGYKTGIEESGLYIHDDRFGPYARAKFIALGPLSLPDTQKQTWGMILQARDDAGNWLEAHEVLVPDFLIAPMQKKARLPLSFAINTCKTIVDNIAEEFRAVAPSGAEPHRLTYTVRLEEIADVKTRVVKSVPAQSFRDTNGTAIPLTSEQRVVWLDEKNRFLTWHFARLQWVAEFKYLDQPAFSLLIDATEIPQGNAVSAILRDSPIACEATLALLQPYAGKSSEANEGDKNSFFDSFLRKLHQRVEGLSHHLDITYGAPRAPSYLKSEEFAGGDIVLNGSLKIFYDATADSIEAHFPQQATAANPAPLIWAISHDGALLIGVEENRMGHPCLTGFKPARIAGELHRLSNGWAINAKSGRYSGDYSDKDSLLENALRRFKSTFAASSAQLSIAKPTPAVVPVPADLSPRSGSPS